MAGLEVRQSPGAEPRFFYGYIVVVAAFLIMVMVWGTYLTFGVFFKSLLAEFGQTRAMTSAAFSLSWIVTGLLSGVMGGLNDRLGPRTVITLCGFLLGLGYLLMSQISAVWQLYLLYGAVIGTALSGVFVPLTSTVARWFLERRNMMTGIVVAGTGVGQVIMPPVAIQLISTYGWRTSYAIMGIIALVLLIIAAQFLRRDPTQMGQLPYGKNSGGEQGVKVITEGFSLKEAAYTKQFWVVFTMLLCFGFLLQAVLVHIVPHSTELGISATTAANILATVGGASIIGRVILGISADRIGNRQVFIVGFTLMSAALFWLVPTTEVWMLYLFAVIFGVAYGGCVTSESPLIARLFGLRSHGLILGVAVLGFTIGASLGPIVAGYIFDVTGSYQVAFLVCAAISIVGLVLTAILTPITGEGGQHKMSFHI